MRKILLDMTAGNSLLQHAVQLHSQNQLKEAEVAYLKVLAIEPQNAIALHHLGILDLIANRLDSARARLIAASEAAPSDGGPHFHLAEVARRQDRIGDAIDEYKRALELSPTLLVSYQALGDLLIQKGRAAEAIEPLRILVNASPQLSGAWMLIGRAFVAMGQREQAVFAFNQVVQLAPHSIAALKQVGELELSLGNSQGRDRVAALRSENREFKSPCSIAC